MKLIDFLPAGMASMLGCTTDAQLAKENPAGPTAPKEASSVKLILQPIEVFDDEDVKEAAARVRKKCGEGLGVTMEDALEAEVFAIRNKAGIISWSGRDFDTSGTRQLDIDYAAAWAEKFRTELLAVLES